MICKECGKEFEPKTKRDVYCSKDCYASSRKEQSRLNANRYYHQHKITQYKICKACGATFATKQGGAVTCANDECKRNYRAMKAREKYIKKREALPEKPPKQPCECAVCSRLFIPHKPNTKVCSEECREQFKKDYHKRYRQMAKLKPKDEFYLPKPKAETKPLDGKVLHRAEMTVDEYNRTHGTNYSYGQYVFYVESKGVK